MPGWLRILLAIFIPPFSVLDKGWDKLVITAALWFTTGIGGTLAALYFILDGSTYDRWKRDAFEDESYAYRDMPPTKAKRAPREYIEMADGDMLEVVDTDDEERRQRLSGM
jgi:uncharacterized membrane protein YqaE (UPF0057 family)